MTTEQMDAIDDMRREERERERRTHFYVRPIFAWYDWWIGGYWDRKNRRLYLMVPFVGIVIERAQTQLEEA